MRIQIRSTELSELQLALEGEYEEAVQLLKRNGFVAEYSATFVSSPSENPGYITIAGRKP